MGDPRIMPKPRKKVMGDGCLRGAGLSASQKEFLCLGQADLEGGSLRVYLYQ